MHVHLDAVGGIAGDMFLAACLDAWPQFEPGLHEAIRAAGLPAHWDIHVTKARSHGFAGTRFNVSTLRGSRERPTGKYSEIRRGIEASDLVTPVIERAVDVFERLAVAEAAAHGVSLDDVHFHEIADWDSVADIVGAAWMIEACDATSWSISALPAGGGTVATAHGRIPLPAPAVVRLLQGYPVVDDGVGGERVTPTGAAVVAHLEPRVGGAGNGLIGRTGHGLGSRDLPDRPNMLRLLALDPLPAPLRSEDEWETGAVSVITFDVDDQTAEDLAVGLDAIRKVDGVLDIVQSSVIGKKGRMMMTVRVLCQPDARDAAIWVCFDQTTTIGLRWHDEARAELPRDHVSVDGVGGKRVVRPGRVPTTKPDMDELARLGVTSAERSQVRARFTVRDEQDQQ